MFQSPSIWSSFSFYKYRKITTLFKVLLVLTPDVIWTTPRAGEVLGLLPVLLIFCPGSAPSTVQSVSMSQCHFLAVLGVLPQVLYHFSGSSTSLGEVQITSFSQYSLDYLCNHLEVHPPRIYILYPGSFDNPD